MPPEKWLPFSAETVSQVPETEGVFILYDANKEIIYIKGTMNLKEELQELLETGVEAGYFKFEEVGMYTARESELLQQYIQAHGRMPKLNVELEFF